MKGLSILTGVLAGIGVFPLWFCAFLMFFYSADVPHLMDVFVGYGAALLSFYGGVHWGLAFATPVIITPAEQRNNFDLQHVFFGIALAFFGWFSLVVVASGLVFGGLILLLCCFTLSYLTESKMLQKGGLPRGYLNIRRGVTYSAGACVILVIVRQIS